MAGIRRKLQSWLAPGQERAQFLTHRPRNLPHVSKIQKNVFTFIGFGSFGDPNAASYGGNAVPPKGSQRPSKGVKQVIPVTITSRLADL